jgi:hypothetical protein
MAITISDPLAQSFLVDGTSYPYGVFLSSINLFFSAKPGTNLSVPINICIVPTVSGIPSGKVLDYSYVSLTPDKVNTSSSPFYLDSTTYTNFAFQAPVKINPDELYAIIIKSNSPDYFIWTAVQGGTAIRSTLKKSLTSDPPTESTKITSLPKVGSLFKSQNSITWTPIQNEALMFQINRCVFTTSANPSIVFNITKGLPQNKPGTATPVDVATANVTYDAVNLTTTAINPGTSIITYTMTPTLSSGTTDSTYKVTPGNFGSPTTTDIYFNDNKGSRLLVANSNTSFQLNATLYSFNNTVSPLLSDDGLSVYTTKYRINNLELSNNSINFVSGGSGYLAGGNGVLSGTANLTIAAPTSSYGTQAYAAANVVMGVIDKIYITTAGSGYVDTPNVTILASNTTAAVVSINGETSVNGGNANTRYITKTVTLAAGADSEDLRVYFTAYRPPNSDINIYYKILSRSDTDNIDNQSWQRMTLINSSSALYSQSMNQLYEFVAAPGTNSIASGLVSYTNTQGLTFNNFYRYAIKVVMSTSDSTFSPYLTDLRVIALPSGV